MIASLGMYDRAETADANDRFWALIRDGLRAGKMAAPDALTRGDGAYWSAWEAPDLTLSQTCGYPFRTRLHQKVRLIGTPDYGLPGCAPGYYNSVFVVRTKDDRQSLTDFRDARFAFNEALSQSGWAAPQTHMKSLGFHFKPSLQSGGHRLSAQAVVEGRADIAAMDALTYALCLRYDPFMADLREIARTRPTPGLPYIAGKGMDTEAAFSAIEGAIANLSPADAKTLSLRGLVRIKPEIYLAVPNPLQPEECA